MFNPTLEQAKQLAPDYPLIPVAASYYADTETPISVFKKLQTDSDCFLLESVEQGNERSRYSFLGRNPFLIFESKGQTIRMTDANGKTTETEGNPMQVLQQLTDQYRAPRLAGMPSFCGGAVGFFGYDVARLYENLPDAPPDDCNLPDMRFLFMDEIVAFDHKEQKLLVVVNMRTDGDLVHRYERAQRRITEIKSELDGAVIPRRKHPVRLADEVQVSSNMTKEEYCRGVEKVKEYIVNGDVFQLVFAQRFTMETAADPLDVYRALRVINPSPYMYYLKFDGYQIVGASPELLVRVQDGKVRTCPIAGSRPRGKTPAEDEENCRSLLADPKENAEHVMLVDLGRNDVGRVCKFGSVTVSRLKYLQKFSHIIHMTSDVDGELRSDKTPLDALGAILPAGTLSGAPKIRAMEIIDELETVRRGIYGGAIGYIGFDGSFDSCITIRTGLFKDGRCHVGAGAGIVYDSVPETEYQESVNKATAMFKAVEQAAEIE